MATVILKTAIELCGGQCDFHVPHRLLEGYGMRDEVIERAATEGVRLIISVDTGIRAFAAAETARGLNLDLIVTDHHLPQGTRRAAGAGRAESQPGGLRVSLQASVRGGSGVQAGAGAAGAKRPRAPDAVVSEGGCHRHHRRRRAAGGRESHLRQPWAAGAAQSGESGAAGAAGGREHRARHGRSPPPRSPSASPRA